MEEIENDDLDELEAHLYAQIHHDSVDTNDKLSEQPSINQSQFQDETQQDRHEIESTKAVGDQTNDINLIKNNTSSVEETNAFTNKNFTKEPTVQASCSANADTLPTNTTLVNKNVDVGPSTPVTGASQFHTDKSKNQKKREANTNANKNKKQKNKSNQTTLHKEGIRMNPAAALNHKGREHKLNANKKSGIKEILQKGPFAQQSQKLSKAKRLATKKQKSTEVQNKRNRLVINETINLTLSDESTDNDDIEIVPLPEPQVLVIEDSDDDKNRADVKQNITMLEENAVDAADVDIKNVTIIESKIERDIKKDIPESHTEMHSSRPNSPCSVQSFDDFIGKRNRNEAIRRKSEQADDVDVLILTAEDDSMLDAASSNKQTDLPESEVVEVNENSHSVEDSSALNEFRIPNQTTRQRNTFCVKEKEFRATDIYESESDINDSVYSKGLPKQTIIRNIDSRSSEDSDDDVVDITEIDVNPKIKRLRKRRASSNKDSEPNNDDSTDTDEHENEGVVKTSVPGIVRGPAVERSITKLIKNPCNTASRKRNKRAKNDNAFMQTLNNLAQGEEELVENEDSNEAITARDIAEKVLQVERGTLRESVQDTIDNDDDDDDDDVVMHTVSSTDDEAIPDEDGLKKFEKIFQTIDNMNYTEEREVLNETVFINSDHEEMETSLPVEDLMAMPSTRRRPMDAGSNNQNVSAKRKIKYFVTDTDTTRMWPIDMFKFYNSSWNGEKFNVNEIRARMNPNVADWKICSLDRFPHGRPITKKLKCYNCCEFGHTKQHCKRPRKALVCSMCGESGHREPRCPNTVCLRCGNKTLAFVKNCNACTFHDRLTCPLCKVRGHILDNCPDNWRRYHSTTKSDVAPESHIVYNKKLCCCVCGRRGHLSDTCAYQKLMEYPLILSKIKSHTKSYTNLSVSRGNSPIKLRLLYNPEVCVSFKFLIKTMENSSYARFLSVVGLKYMMQKKRRSINVISDIKIKKARKSVTEPDQVQEVSESTISTTQNININDDAMDESVEANESLLLEDRENTVKELPQYIGSTQPMTPVGDSDSNYSFSEHFAIDKETRADGPSSSKVQNSHKKSRSTAEFLPEFVPLNTSSTNGQKKSLQMESSPDFISFNTPTTTKHNQSEKFLPPSGLLKMNRYFSISNTPTSTPNTPEIAFEEERPTEAMICIPKELVKYFESTDGCNFLEEKSKIYDTRVNIRNSSAGKMLYIFGLSANQKSFHNDILDKFSEVELNNEMNKRTENMPKVPKRIDVLIRFLREHINQLLQKLGNVNDLLNRMNYHENLRSKNGYKMAEKERRLLNMILIGQAGLENGTHHLDKLIFILKQLLNDFNGDQNVPNGLRYEIDEHWKFIFTSYRHNDYKHLVRQYNSLLSKNRMHNINIDPVLLGNSSLDMDLTKQQKDRMEQIRHQESTISSKSSKSNSPNYVPNPFHKNLRNVSYRNSGNSSNPEINISLNITNKKVNATPNKNKSDSGTLTQLKKQVSLTPPFKNPQQKSSVGRIIQNVTNKESICDNLLSEISTESTQQTTSNQKRLLNATAASMFWSREALKYIDNCLVLAEMNTELLTKLKLIQYKSQTGGLSYNDYRAVIKLHSAMTDGA
ncbi:uncharacterized protein LOC119671775 [Teleopsis dalmanni]|uniref:uncharacterized protein LOC119671775 n=1 Tax=Teleopsis dalmanni TaxID=139649 RepID=UPI0018CDAF12|nr:uncharacterized protein LOC119671775 [Teleopsis dalmanni]XP_037938597.1 uncharacterized protein LOC119671775 [Teleopsis dalmanni]